MGTFLLPARFSLPEMLTVGRDRLAAALAAEFAEFTPVGDLESSELLLDYHRARGAQWLPASVFAGEVSVPTLGAIQLHLTALAVGFVIVNHDLPDDLEVDLEEEAARQAFKRHEKPISEAVAPFVREWADRALAAVDPAVAQPRPVQAMPSGRLLWWHRVAHNPLPGKEFPAAQYYGQRAELANGAEYVVGNGFSYLRGDRALLPDVLEGLMLATQEWLVVDEAKRLLTAHLVELSRSHQEGFVRLEAQYQDVLRLTEEVTLRNLVLSEESRYLSNARLCAKDAASRAWNIAGEVAQLEERACALRDLFGLHRERVSSARDDRRNRYIFVFTGVALLQATLVWYDFLTEDDVSVAAAPRPTISLTVLAGTLLVLTGAIAFDPLRRLWSVLRRQVRLSRASRDDD